MGKVQARFLGESITTDASDGARELYNRGRFGALKRSSVVLSLFEAYYLMEKGKLVVMANNKAVNDDVFLKKARKKLKNFFTKYVIFRDLRDRGYIIKTALKFGAEFRVYDKGINPGQGHAKWIVYPVHESEALTWHDFAAKNRVAHSTKKTLLIGIVDDEEDVTYYEVAWKKP